MAGKPDSQPQPGEHGTGEGEQDQALSARVDRLETGQESLSGKVDKILGIVSGGDGGGHAGKPTASADKGDGASVAHEIRAQLEERDRRDAEAKAQGERDSTIADLQAKVAELTEKKPGPLPRRSTKIMWGGE